MLAVEKTSSQHETLSYGLKAREETGDKNHKTQRALKKARPCQQENNETKMMIFIASPLEMNSIGLRLEDPLGWPPQGR